MAWARARVAQTLGADNQARGCFASSQLNDARKDSQGTWASAFNGAFFFKRLRGRQESEIEDEEGGGKIPGRAWRPRVHYVWDELLDELLPPDGSGRSPAGSFQEFFRIVVDGG